MDSVNFFNSVNDDLANMTTQAKNALSQMGNVVQQQYSGNFDIKTGLPTQDQPILLPSALSNYYDSAIQKINNVLTNINLQAYTAIDFSNITAKTLPGNFTLDEKTFNTAQWDENDRYWNNITSTLDHFISDLTSQTNLDQVIKVLTDPILAKQNAMYNKDYELKSQALRDSIGAANSATGAKGFLYPNIITVALKMKAQQDFLFSMSQSARDLIKEMFEYSRNIYQFSIEKGITTHEADIEFNMKYADLLIKVYESKLKFVIEDLKAQIELKTQIAKARLEEIGKVIDLLDAEIKAMSEKDKNVIENSKIRIDALLKNHELDIGVALSKAKELVGSYATQAQSAAHVAAASAQIKITNG